MSNARPQDLTLVVLTDAVYLAGTLRFLESFTRHNGQYPTIALSRCQETLTDPRLSKITTQQVHIDPSHYDSIQPYKKRHSKRHAETFYKFEAFQDFGYERNLYLDSDLLCLRPVPALIDPEGNTLRAVRDSGFRPTRSYKGHPNEINSGVLSIPKNLLGTKTVGELQKIARNEPGRGGYNSGDQSIINKWIHRNHIRLTLLPEEYNLIKKDYRDSSGLNQCRMLHYCHRKPWLTSNVPLSELERLWHEDQPNSK